MKFFNNARPPQHRALVIYGPATVSDEDEETQDEASPANLSISTSNLSTQTFVNSTSNMSTKVIDFTKIQRSNNKTIFANNTSHGLPKCPVTPPNLGKKDFFVHEGLSTCYY